MKRQFTLALLATSALGFVSGIADAASRIDGTDPDALDVRSETAHYDAARIIDDRSARELFFRIRKAAEDVCSTGSYPRGYEMMLEHSCSESAVQEAVRNANLPALDAYYANLPKALLEPRH